VKNQIRIRFSLFIGIQLIILLLNGCKKEQTIPAPNLTNGKTTAVFNPNVTYGTLMDQDSNIYKTVTIGTQTWMAENLRTTKYRNGDPISHWNISDFKVTAGAYCNYNYTKDVDSIATFGRLYNGYAIKDRRNIAPSGWHIPAYYDWNILISYLGATDTLLAGKLKEAGLTHWMTPNPRATNETGFTALPGGYVNSGGFSLIGMECVWWTTDEGASEFLGYYSYYLGTESIYYDWLSFGPSGENYNGGCSVRCVKDN
jgi:uncharacterized protein (TIGR02145 family)